MSDDPPPDRPGVNPLMEEAALWFARMRGPEAEEHRAEFEAWLARGALHRGAYNRAAETYNLGKFLSKDGSLAEDGAAGKAALKPAAVRRRSWRPALVVGLGLVALIAWAVLARPAVFMFGEADQVAGTHVRPGQQRVELASGRDDVRTERLADGSTVTLGPLSLLAVSFDGGRRILRLERGQARFEVAHDRRPFIVFAGHGSITAHGTVFEVTVRRDDQVEVKLLRGSVDVGVPSLASRREVRRLSPGQSLTFGIPVAGTPLTAPISPGTQEPTAKAAEEGAEGSRMREFDGARMADVIAAANATAGVPIRIIAAGTGERRISGRFRIDDAEKLADRLARAYDLQIERRAGEIFLLER